MIHLHVGPDKAASHSTNIARLRKGRRSFLLRMGLLAAILAITGPLAARENNNPLAERSQFFGQFDVSIVNLDVIVTDKNGEPVDGLARDDFQLLVDGQPTEILNFFAASETVTEIAVGSPVDEIVEEPIIPESQRLWMVVYIDSTSVRGSDRNRVINELKTLLETNLGHGDRVMIVTQGGNQEIRHRFGDPPEKLPEVLDEIAHEIGGMNQYESARLSILNRIQRSADATTRGTQQGSTGALQQDTRSVEAENLLGEVYGWVQWRRSGLRQSISRIEALMDGLSGIEGRKALLYVGEGSPYRIGETLFQSWIDHYRSMFAAMRDPPANLVSLNAHREANRYSVQREYFRLAAHASASRVGFYAIDAAKPGVTTAVSAEFSGASSSYVGETSRSIAQQESLQRLVTTTGGRYLSDLGRIDSVVEGLQDDFSHYYSLGFTPQGEADGEPKNVEVVLTDPDLKVRHRNSFRAKSLDERMAEQLYSALYLGVVPNPLAVDLELIDSEKIEKNRFKLTLLARIPISSLLLVPQADELLGRATAWLAVADEKGGMSDVHGRRLPIRVQQKELGNASFQDVGYTLQIVVKPVDQTIALVVRDELAIVTSTVTLDLEKDWLKAIDG